MKRVHVLVAAAAVALFIAAAGALSGVAATNPQTTRSHSHADAMPAIQAEATKTPDPCKVGDPAEDAKTNAADADEAASEKAAKLTKAADKIEDANEKAKAKAEANIEKDTLKACEAARKKKTTTTV
jgi:hypothetical protein